MENDTLSTPEAQRSFWATTPGMLTGYIVIILGICWLYAFMKHENAADTLTGAAVSTSMQSDLKAAIMKYDQVVRNAEQNQDTSQLASVAMGSENNLESEIISDERSQGYRASSALKNITFERFKVNIANNRAEVQVTETWDKQWVSTRTGRPFGETYTNHQVHYLIFLIRPAGDWLVYSVIEEG